MYSVDEEESLRRSKRVRLNAETHSASGSGGGSRHNTRLISAGTGKNSLK
jgi:hypothetical protein